MKTPVTLLAIFLVFYFASSCKKGDTSNVVPPYDSTHYKDSVKHVTDSIAHVTDSIAHVADSIYRSPYGTYYGIYSKWGKYLGHIFSSSGPSYYYVTEHTNDSIFIGHTKGTRSIYDKYFLKNASNHYYEEVNNGSAYKYTFEANINNGTITIHIYEGGSTMDGYENGEFEGGKKK